MRAELRRRCTPAGSELRTQLLTELRDRGHAAVDGRALPAPLLGLRMEVAQIERRSEGDPDGGVLGRQPVAAPLEAQVVAQPGDEDGNDLRVRRRQ